MCNKLFRNSSLSFEYNTVHRCTVCIIKRLVFEIQIIAHILLNSYSFSDEFNIEYDWFEIQRLAFFMIHSVDKRWYMTSPFLRRKYRIKAELEIFHWNSRPKRPVVNLPTKHMHIYSIVRKGHPRLSLPSPTVFANPDSLCHPWCLVAFLWFCCAFCLVFCLSQFTCFSKLILRNMTESCMVLKSSVTTVMMMSSILSIRWSLSAENLRSTRK